MLRRLLNIASIVCLVLCVALMGMWVRSYWVEDFCEWSSQTRNYGMFSDNGRVGLQRAEFFAGQFVFHFGELPARDAINSSFVAQSKLGMSLATWQHGWFASISYAWVLLILGVAATSPWLPWSNRFSLRTLLVATTVLAVVLGMSAWLDRAWIGK
jgi:hypothetical protein